MYLNRVKTNVGIPYLFLYPSLSHGFYFAFISVSCRHDRCPTSRKADQQTNKKNKTQLQKSSVSAATHSCLSWPLIVTLQRWWVLTTMLITHDEKPDRPQRCFVTLRGGLKRDRNLVDADGNVPPSPPTSLSEELYVI